MTSFEQQRYLVVRVPEDAAAGTALPVLTVVDTPEAALAAAHSAGDSNVLVIEASQPTMDRPRSFRAWMARRKNLRLEFQPAHAGPGTTTH